MFRIEQYSRAFAWMVPVARPRGSIMLSTRALLIAVPLVAVAISLPSHQVSSAFPALPGAWAAVLAAAVLYGFAHALRAARLALLAAPALNMHVRTVVLLHFHTAPVSFIVPFKLGELYRWQQLAWLSRNPGGSLLIVLMDRMLDALVLLLALAAVAGFGGRLPPGTAAIAGLLAFATVLGLFVVLVAPGCLEALQAYILQNHSAPRARRVLRIVDASRLMISSVRERLHGNLMLLLSLSAVIWVIESGMIVLLAQQAGFGAFLPSFAQTLFPQHPDGTTLEVASLYRLTCLLTLLPLWGVATALYLTRIRSPLRTVPAFTPSFSARRTRRLHLRVTAKTL